MKFLIVGVGAIGGAFLAFLSRAGHRAAGLVKKGRKIDSLKVEGLWGDFEVKVETVEDISELDFVPDIVILSVKSYDTQRALQTVKPLFETSPSVKLLIAQNGYGNYEKATSLLGEGRVILSRIIFGSEKHGDNRIRITVCADDVVIGDPSMKISPEELKGLAELLTEAGIPTRYEREVYKFLWDKIIYNCALNPLGALLEVNYGYLAQTPHTREIMNRIIEEIFEVLKLKGIETFWGGPEEYKKAFYEKLIPPTASHYPSMLRDIGRGKTEIDSLNGAICDLAREVGIEAPTNRTITDLIKAKERLFQS